MDLKSLQVKAPSAKATGTLPVYRPSANTFVRVRPEQDAHRRYLLFELWDRGESFLASPTLRTQLTGIAAERDLHVASDEKGNVFLWPLSAQGANGRPNSWSDSAEHVAKTAEGQWVKVAANSAERRYEVIATRQHGAEPAWPTESLDELVARSFAGRVIDSIDHPAVQEARTLAQRRK